MAQIPPQVGIDPMPEPIEESDPMGRGQTTVWAETKKYWNASSWTAAPYLEPLRAERVAGPAMSEASLRYHGGPAVKREDTVAFAPYEPLDLLGHYVRIRGSWNADGQPEQEYPAHPTTPFTIWVGVFTRESFQVHGADTVDEDDDATKVPLADQLLTAFGLDVLLDRVTLSRARAYQMIRRESATPGYYEQSGEDDLVEDDVISIDRAPTFNRRSQWGSSQRGNRSYYATEEGQGQFIFAGTVRYGPPHSETQDPGEWSNFDIIDTLLAENRPSRVLTDPVLGDLDFVLGGQAAALANMVEVHRLVGMTIREIINRLISRKRGFGWELRVNDDAPGAPAEIHVYTLTDDDIVVGEEVVLPANTETISMAAEAWRDQEPLRIDRRLDQRYERIIVYGEPIQTVCTLRVSEDAERKEYGTLRRGWSTTIEDDFKTARGATEEAQKNDNYRALDKFRRVWTTFVVMDGWQGQCGTSMTKNCLPIPTDTGGIIEPLWGNIDGASPVHASLFTDGRSFMRRLPIWETAANIIGEANPEAMKPVAFLLDERQDRSVQWPGRLRMLDGELGIELGADPDFRHMLARDNWSASDDTPPSPTLDEHNPQPNAAGAALVDGEHTAPDGSVQPYAGSFDYRTLRVTVGLETDRRIRVVKDLYVIPDIPDEPPDVGRVLTLHVPDAHYWYRADQTLLELVADGGSVLSAATLRDDSERLKTVAAIAAQWYRHDRATISQTRAVIYSAPPPGTMVTQLFETQDLVRVATPVTRVTWQFGADPRTTIETAYSELDAQAVEVARVA